jgi:hypothetical protein
MLKRLIRALAVRVLANMAVIAIKTVWKPCVYNTRTMAFQGLAASSSQRTKMNCSNLQVMPTGRLAVDSNLLITFWKIAPDSLGGG